MHIEPGVVEGAKMVLAYAAAAASAVLAASMSRYTIANDGGAKALLLRSIVTTLLVLTFFQVLPHYTRGVSEVHFIFGATMYLVFGGGPAAIGLALGLALQGLFFAPADLPQYFLNVTTLIVPLYLVTKLAARLVPEHAPYVGLKLYHAFLLALAYQGGIIVMVVLWSVYGQGFGAENLGRIGVFAANYLVVIVVEPLVALGVLAMAKAMKPVAVDHPFLYRRLHHPVN